MNEKTEEQILNEIEIHGSNAVRLLKKSHEIHLSALDLNNLDEHIIVMKRSALFLKFAIDELNKAANLQTIFSQRHLDSILNKKSKLDIR